MHSDSTGIMIGSDPYPGLYLTGDLLSGRSVKCETFDNEPLLLNDDF